MNTSADDGEVAIVSVLRAPFHTCKAYRVESDSDGSSFPSDDMVFGEDDYAEVLGDTELYRRGYTLKDVEAADAAVKAVGMVRGRFCLEWYDQVLQLKRNEQYDEALSLLMEILAATERMQDQESVNIPITAALLDGDAAEVRIRPPGPAWTEQAAIIYRKLGRLEDELAVIDRWLARNGPTTKSSRATLAKMRARRAKTERLLARQHNS